MNISVRISFKVESCENMWIGSRLSVSTDVRSNVSPSESVVSRGADIKNTEKNVHINSSNFEFAFSVILSLLNNSFGTPLKVHLQTFLENYWDILKSIAKILEIFFQFFHVTFWTQKFFPRYKIFSNFFVLHFWYRNFFSKHRNFAKFNMSHIHFLTYLRKFLNLKKVMIFNLSHHSIKFAVQLFLTYLQSYPGTKFFRQFFHF